jgi:hypothetical protein
MTNILLSLSYFSSICAHTFFCQSWYVLCSCLSKSKAITPNFILQETLRTFLTLVSAFETAEKVYVQCELWGNMTRRNRDQFNLWRLYTSPDRLQLYPWNITIQAACTTGFGKQLREKLSFLWLLQIVCCHTQVDCSFQHKMVIENE